MCACALFRTLPCSSDPHLTASPTLWRRGSHLPTPEFRCYRHAPFVARSLSRVLYNTITPYATLVCILLSCRVLTFFSLSLSLSLSQLSLSIDNQAITVSKDEVVKACKDKKHGEDGVWTREVAKHFGPCLKKFAGMTSLEKYVAPTKTSHMLDCTIVKECKDYTVSNNGWTVRGNE